MTSPDFSQYVNLTIYDEQPNVIYQNALEYARESFPELDFPTGGIEDAMLQTVAYMAGFTSGMINRVPDAIAEVIVGLLGVTRSTGTVASASAGFTFIDGRTATIPAGTRLSYTDNSGPNPVTYAFQTTESISGTSSATCPIEGLTLESFPTLLSGQALRLLSPISFVASVALTSDLDAGSGPEPNSSYLSRGIAQLRSYSSALVVPSQFDAYVLTNFPDVYRCKTYSRVDPANEDLNTGGSDNGFVTIYVVGKSGDVLSVSKPSLAAEIESSVAEKAIAGLDINVEDAHIESIDLQVQVKLAAGFDSDNTKQLILEAINTYLHPDYWEWGSVVRYNELVALISNVSGVDYVDSLETRFTGDPTFGTIDLEFTCFGSLADNTMTTTDISFVGA